MVSSMLTHASAYSQANERACILADHYPEREYLLSSTKARILTQKALLGKGGGGSEGERESSAPPRTGAVRRPARGGAGIWLESMLTYADVT